MTDKYFIASNVPNSCTKFTEPKNSWLVTIEGILIILYIAASIVIVSALW